MQPISRDHIENFVDEWDASVEDSFPIDVFCSGSAWQLAFHDAFLPDRPLYFAHGAGATLVLAEREFSDGQKILEPLENMWGFSSPLIGREAVSLLANFLRSHPQPVHLQGLPGDESLMSCVFERLADRNAIRVLQPITRFVASLEGGVEGWRSRRSPSFRRNLRAVLRRVTREEVEFEWLRVSGSRDVSDLYERVLAVERRSRKFSEGGGAALDPMRSFYAGLWPRLAETGQLRLLLAHREGETLGYLHGAVVGRHFRGLQFSFDETATELGLGNAMQYEALRLLCAEGIQTYDLGSYSDYKARWAESGLTTLGLFLRPRPGGG